MKRLTLNQAAEALCKSPRWLRDWLAKHPQDPNGRRYYAQAGRTKIFTQADIGCIALAVLQEQAGEELAVGPSENPKDGWVYFIQGGDWIKIGFTRCGRERLKKMATDAPVELTFLHAEPGTFKTEKILHREFADLRTRGEWFRKDKRILAHIEQRKQIVGDILDQAR